MNRNSMIGLFLIAFSIPFLRTAYNSAMFALRSNTGGSATGKAVVFGILGGIPLLVGVIFLFKKKKTNPAIK